MPSPKNIKQQKNLEDIIFNGKLPPQAMDLEEAVIGAAMLEKSAAGKVIEILEPDTFYSDSNKLIWQAIKTLYHNSKPVDILTVISQLKTDGKLDLAGGAFNISNLTSRVASAANIEYHSHILVQKYIARSLITIAGEIGQRAFDDTTDPFELKEYAISQIEALGNTNLSTIKEFGKVMSQVYEGMKNASVMEGDMLGLPSKLKTVNDITLGYCAPDVEVVAAYTGEGKTSWALSEAYHIAKSGTPVAFLCAEMKDFQLAWKILSDEITAEIKDIRLAKHLQESQWDQVLEIVQKSYNIPLYILDVAGSNVNQICSLTKELCRKHGVKKMFLDYLQLIDGPPEMRFGTREAEVSYVAKKMKQLAMILNISIMELCQLKRPEAGVKRMPALSDLRESGAIEQNADEVVFLFSPFSYGIETIKGLDHVYRDSDTLWIRAKARQGSKGPHLVKYIKKYNRFEDIEPMSEVYKSLEHKNYSEPDNGDETDNLPF